LVIGLVFLHNFLALVGGYSWGKLFKLPPADCRSLAIETGIQNSGLGLLLIFSFFDSLGGMALISAWWGIWHIIAGFAVTAYWTKIKKMVPTD
jgi:BASS family bile acid:Na+ symporter